MRFVQFSSFLILLLAFSVSAQEPDRLCPKIKVIPPARVTNPGDEMTFVADVSGIGLETKYEWTVTSGKIVEGQGTPAIKVADTQPNTAVTATVKLKGIPMGCEDSASEVAGVAQVPPIESVDEWRKLSRNDERGRLDALFADVLSNPGYKGVLLLIGVPATKRNVINSRIRFIVQHAKFRKFDTKLLVFVFDNEDADYQLTMVYRLRSEADFPCPGCVVIRASDVK